MSILIFIAFVIWAVVICVNGGTKGSKRRAAQQAANFKMPEELSLYEHRLDCENAVTGGFNPDSYRGDTR